MERPGLPKKVKNKNTNKLSKAKTPHKIIYGDFPLNGRDNLVI